MNYQNPDAALPATIRDRPPIPIAAELGNTPIVPPASVTGRSLTLVVAIMCFLLCLTAGVVYMVRQSANAWLRDIDAEITVQIRPGANAADSERASREIAAFLQGQIGVVKATPLPQDDLTALVKPWLGSIRSLNALQLPQLIAIEIDRQNPPDVEALKGVIEQRFPGATLDDHRRWRKQIRTLTGALAFSGLAVIILVTAATIAIIIAAARSAMASNRDIIEVLNFVGAEERFIIRQFERHFLKLGVKAGIVGALAAAAVFLFMPYIADYAAGSAAADAEMRRVVGSGSLDAAGYALLALMVGLIALICQITSRFGVKRILHQQNR